ncbi:MAG: hypothetical protein ACR2H5_00770 [Ktedonobacteraceae bacterium]
MSMDDQYKEMRRFQDEMARFNENLKASMHDLQAHHDHVDPHWHDAMRKTYDSHWEPLEQHIQQYIKREGPAYDRFLKSKIISLGRYLNGS